MYVDKRNHVLKKYKMISKKDEKNDFKKNIIWEKYNKPVRSKYYELYRYSSKTGDKDYLSLIIHKFDKSRNSFNIKDPIYYESI